jgi:HEAT repeat protein
MHATTGDHPEYARAAAIKAMAVHRHPAVVEPIIAALEDPDQTVRFAAMRALRAYRDGRAIEPLRAYVRNSENHSQSPGGVAEALEQSAKSSAGAKTYGRLGAVRFRQSEHERRRCDHLSPLGNPTG